MQPVHIGRVKVCRGGRQSCPGRLHLLHAYARGPREASYAGVEAHLTPRVAMYALPRKRYRRAQ